MAKKKRTDRAIAKDNAWKSFSKYIRTRDCLRTTGDPDFGRCISCNKYLPFKKLQAGHFICGRHNAVLFQEKGVHAQCRNCNKYLYGNTLPYRRKIVELYGEGFDEVLEEESKKNIQYKLHDFIEIKEKYDKKTKELQAHHDRVA